ncbi:MAG: hypothetical protein ACOC0A_01790, partial [Planctomycetota bacterium]
EPVNKAAEVGVYGEYLVVNRVDIAVGGHVGRLDVPEVEPRVGRLWIGRFHVWADTHGIRSESSWVDLKVDFVTLIIDDIAVREDVNCACAKRQEH